MPEKIENPKTVGDSHGNQFTAKDIDRQGTGQLDRQSAQDILTRIDTPKSRTSEIAKNTYDKPNTAQERNDVAKNQREIATPTGSANQRTIVDHSGTKISGLESVDKKTGERSLYVNQGDSFVQYKSKDGKEWAKTDSSGKPTGEIIRQADKQQSQNSADLLSQRLAHQEQQKQAAQTRDVQEQNKQTLAAPQQKPEIQRPEHQKSEQQKPEQQKPEQQKPNVAAQEAQRQFQQNQQRDAQQNQQRELQQNPRNQVADTSQLLAEREAHRAQQAKPASERGADLNHDGKPDKPWQNNGTDKPAAGQDKGQPAGQPAGQPEKPVNKPDAGTSETPKTRPDSTIEQGRPNNQQGQPHNDQNQAPRNEQALRPVVQPQQQQQQQYDAQGNRPSAYRFSDPQRQDQALQVRPDAQRLDQNWQNRPDSQRWDRGNNPDAQQRVDRTDAGPRSFDQNGRPNLQPGDPRTFDRGNRPDMARPDQPAPGRQADGTITGGRPINDGSKGAVPDGGRPGQMPDSGRPGPMIDARLPGLDGRLPGLDGSRGPQVFDGRGISPLDARAFQHGDLAKGLMPGQFPVDGQLVFNLKAELNGGRLDIQRGDLQNNLMQNLRMLNQDQLLTIQRSLSNQPGELAIRGLRPEMEADRAGLQAGKAIDGILTSRDLASGRTLTADPIGKQLATLLESLNKSMPLDRVPGADQSRLVLKELFAGMKLDQNNTNDSQIQRSLNMRNAENGTQQSLTLKPQQMEAVRELINAVKNQDLLTKDPSKTADTAHTIDAKTTANILTTKQAAEGDLASKQDQNKAIKDAITKDAQNKQQDANSNMPDRRLLNSETKAESNQVKNSNAENGNGNKNNQHDEKNDKKDKAEANKGKKPELDENELAVIMANKVRELKDKEAREKEKQKEKDQEKSKKDPQQKTRLKYRVKEGDTLSAIAARFLNDSQLAAAIFHINRTVIPVISHKERTYASLPLNSMIWIPCEDDLHTFKDSGVGKQYSHIGFQGVQYDSAEEELAARFGRRWFGPSKEEKAEKAEKATRIANIEKVLGRDEEIARPQLKGDAATRRANIESILGPLSERPSDGRLRYTVRLGETLKSIALKHPALNSVEAWKLLASINGLSTETDSKGTPVAVLKRGTVIVLPNKAEVAKFMAERKITQLDFTPQAKAAVSAN